MNVLNVVARNDGKFDLFLNAKIIGEQVDERWLRQEVCARFGYCQGEADQILQEARLDGRAIRKF